MIYFRKIQNIFQKICRLYTIHLHINIIFLSDGSVPFNIFFFFNMLFYYPITEFSNFIYLYVERFS